MYVAEVMMSRSYEPGCSPPQHAQPRRVPEIRRPSLTEKHGRRGGPHHVLDGPYAGDGIFRERKRHGHGADQPAIDIDRAAAHARHDPGMFERAAREPRQNQRFLGADVIQHAQDLDLEFVDLAARKTVLPVPRMPGLMSCKGKKPVCAARAVASAKTAGSAKRGTQPL